MQFNLQHLQGLGIQLPVVNLPPVSLPSMSFNLSSAFSFPVDSATHYLFSSEALQIVDELATRLPSHCKIDAYLNHARLSLLTATQSVTNEFSSFSDWALFQKELSQAALEIVRRSPDCTPQIEQLIQAEIASSVGSFKSLFPIYYRIENNPMAQMRAIEQWISTLEKELGEELTAQAVNQLMEGIAYPLPTMDGVNLWFKGHQRLLEACFDSQLADQISGSPALLKSHYSFNSFRLLYGWIEEAVDATGDSGVLTDPVCWNAVRSAMSLPLSIPTGGAELPIGQWIDFLEIACQRSPNWAQ